MRRLIPFFLMIPIFLLSSTVLFASGFDDIMYGFKQTFSFDTTYHLFGIIGVGIWGNQARNVRVGNLSFLFLLSLGIFCWAGMSFNLTFDIRALIAGEIILLGILVGRSIGLTSSWDVAAIICFGLIHGITIGSHIKGVAHPLYYPIGVLASGIVLLTIGFLTTWFFGIQKLNNAVSRYNNAPFIGGILVGAGITIMIWVLR